MKKILVIALCGMLLAGCGSAGTSDSSASAAAESAGAVSEAASSIEESNSETPSASSAAESETETSSASSSDSASDGRDASAAKEAALEDGFEEQEFYGIQYLADPAWEIELSDNKELCHINTPNENIFFVLGHVAKETIISDKTDGSIYGSMETFLGDNDQDVKREKFENGTHYITFYSDYETDHAYNSIFYTKEGLFAFGLQIIGEVDEKEEDEYVDDFHMMLETMQFEEPVFHTMEESKK